ncbi:Oidioi.mRNA.OKI2018_I69.chr1.g91.t1.cds [Oikopleura dioica]|uniref:Oidioi.mRNA.OKI2018_I69.PAR.g9456.t1.cds n=1 Tax=Oikopleura dioica TaxID=34765 RepID=A0ABN7SNA8_OIKDI|nr:Oidioi.mRNA.OKI2018_I69.PAR.g9456.t1.cds [Oikopleura dioica]CAG5101991.1 Oidioi.mRNA.OKI2018_I69.chr1.g91.t1.cds [Oikopleura dioica]
MINLQDQTKILDTDEEKDLMSKIEEGDLAALIKIQSELDAKQAASTFIIKITNGQLAELQKIVTEKIASKMDTTTEDQTEEMETSGSAKSDDMDTN